MDWSTLPDLGAVALLTCAFGSVARRSHTPISRLWLIGWLMIALHFAAGMFTPEPGAWGTLASVISLNALAWAGLLFTWACVPYRKRTSSRWMLVILLAVNTSYLSLVAAVPQASRALDLIAALYSLLPILLTVISLHRFNHPLRWSLLILNSALAIFLLTVPWRALNGPDLAVDAVMFTIYLGCSLHFWYAFRRATAGCTVTIAGFLAWALVFVAGPIMDAFWPHVRVESEVWNLPKYVAAVGMILLLLEEQIEHNKYLALHDELTGLPNRRLFQDRLARALDRAVRYQSGAALLIIDLDRFKCVNDTAGHHIGDLLLKRVAEIFGSRVRRTDTVARTGGDEFAVILDEPVSREGAEQVGEALIALLKGPIRLEEHTLHVSATVGIALFPEDGDSAESLCIAADRNMYAGKHAATRGAEVGTPD